MKRKFDNQDLFNDGGGNDNASHYYYPGPIQGRIKKPEISGVYVKTPPDVQFFAGASYSPFAFNHCPTTSPLQPQPQPQPQPPQQKARVFCMPMQQLEMSGNCLCCQAPVTTDGCSHAATCCSQHSIPFMRTLKNKHNYCFELFYRDISCRDDGDCDKAHFFSVLVNSIACYKANPSVTNDKFDEIFDMIFNAIPKDTQIHGRFILNWISETCDNVNQKALFVAFGFFFRKDFRYECDSKMIEFIGRLQGREGVFMC